MASVPVSINSNIAESNLQPERKMMVAQPSKTENTLPEISLSEAQVLNALSDEQLAQQPELTEQLLNAAINQNHAPAIEKFLKIYRTFAQADPILVKFAEAQLAKQSRQYGTAISLYRDILATQPDLTPVRIQLATSLYQDQQDNAAKDQFERALADPALPKDIAGLVNLYRQALDERDDWQLSFGLRYLHEKNITNVSDASGFQWRGIPFTKGEGMKPQSAHGVGYWVDIERDFNLTGAHYLHFDNLLYGKNYWDNHSYDDITNRTTLGYTHKRADTRWSVLPFYERQWYGNVRYKWAKGVRLEWSHWVNPNWQLSAAMEYSRDRYHRETLLNGNDKLGSLTLLWRRTPQQFFYVGGDVTAERTRERRYSYDLLGIRAGWGQEWHWGISSRLALLVAKREYKANFALNQTMTYDKARKDNIYQANLTLWKRDWHLWGITPKLQLNWKRQSSNFADIYSYTDKSANMLIEKTF